MVSFHAHRGGIVAILMILAAAPPLWADDSPLRRDEGDIWRIHDPGQMIFVGDESHPGGQPPDSLPACGGDVPCGCGDRLVDDILLTGDLDSCSGFGIVVGADSVTLDCGGRSIGGVRNGTGVWVAGRKHVTIRNCLIRDFRVGVLGSGSRNLAVLSNRFFENDVSGVWTHECDSVSIEENQFLRNGRVAVGQRIGGMATLQSTTNSTVAHNVGERNGTSGLYIGGIVLYESGHNKVARNFLRDTAEDNIWLRLGSGRNEVLDNTLVGSLMDGIWIRESDDNLVSGNTCTDIDLYGIYVRSGRRNKIENNHVLRAGRRAYGGIGIGGQTYVSRDNVVAHNEVRSSLDGLHVHEYAAGNLFLDNRVSGNHTGIRIGNGGYGENRVEGGFISGSAAFDVFVIGERCVTRFVDSPIDTEDVRFECFGDDCLVEVGWFFDVRVVDDQGDPVAGARVVLADRFGETVFEETTGGDGTVDRHEIAEFSMEADGTTTYTDHVLRASMDGYAAAVETVTVDRSIERTVVLSRLGVATDVADSADLQALALAASPVPAAAGVTLRYSLPAGSLGTIHIHDVRGRRIAAPGARLAGGSGEVTWDRRDDRGRRVPQGTYFARLTTGRESRVRKIVLTGR